MACDVDNRSLCYMWFHWGGERKNENKRCKNYIERVVKTNGSEAVYLLSPKYKTANMIFHNTMNADFQTLNKYRDKFIEVYKEDPYEYMIKLNKK